MTTDSIEVLNKLLYSIAAQPDLSPTDLEIVAQLLGSKWYSVQVLAAKVLVKFQPVQATSLLKAWLERHQTNRQMLFEAQKALIACISEADITWIVDLYLKNPQWHYTFLLSALTRFPKQEVIECLLSNCRQKQNTESIIVLLRAPFANRNYILQRLLEDPSIPNKDFAQRAFSWGTLSEEHLLRFHKPP